MKIFSSIIYQTGMVMVLVVYEIRLRERLTEKTLPATAISVRLRGGVEIYTNYILHMSVSIKDKRMLCYDRLPGASQMHSQ